MRQYICLISANRQQKRAVEGFCRKHHLKKPLWEFGPDQAIEQFQLNRQIMTTVCKRPHSCDGLPGLVEYIGHGIRQFIHEAGLQLPSEDELLVPLALGLTVDIEREEIIEGTTHG